MLLLLNDSFLAKGAKIQTCIDNCIHFQANLTLKIDNQVFRDRIVHTAAKYNFLFRKSHDKIFHFSAKSQIIFHWDFHQNWNFWQKMCILAQCAFTVSVSIDSRLDKRVNIEHDDREQFSLIFQFLTLFKIFQKSTVTQKKEMMIYYLHHVVFLRTCLYTL